MSPGSQPPTKRRRRVTSTAGQGGPRDLLEAFGRYYQRVERDSSGNLAVYCRCGYAQVIAWPDDVTYILEQLRYAHAHHNHAVTRR